jgi:hypothetical protein
VLQTRQPIMANQTCERCLATSSHLFQLPIASPQSINKGLALAQGQVVNVVSCYYYAGYYSFGKKKYKRGEDPTESIGSEFGHQIKFNASRRRRLGTASSAIARRGRGVVYHIIQCEHCVFGPGASCM